MSDTRPLTRKEMGEYIRHLADLCGLRDWTITLAAQPTDAGNNGQVACTYGRKQATIQLAHDWPDKDPEEVRHTVTHELLHCHLDPVSRVLENVETNLGEAVYGVVRCAHRDAIEWAVDGIADAVAPLLPLPVKTKATRKKAA